MLYIVYNDLGPNKQNKLTIKKFKNWENIQDALTNKHITKKGLDGILKKVIGVVGIEEGGGGGEMTFEQFVQVLDAVEEILTFDDDDSTTTTATTAAGTDKSGNGFAPKATTAATVATTSTAPAPVAAAPTPTAYVLPPFTLPPFELPPFELPDSALPTAKQVSATLDDTTDDDTTDDEGEEEEEEEEEVITPPSDWKQQGPPTPSGKGFARTQETQLSKKEQRKMDHKLSPDQIAANEVATELFDDLRGRVSTLLPKILMYIIVLNY